MEQQPAKAPDAPFSFFDVATQIDTNSLRIKKACAVLIEATEPFETRYEPNDWKAYLLIQRLPHLLLLLHVVHDILLDAQRESNNIAEILYAASRAAKAQAPTLLKEGEQK